MEPFAPPLGDDDLAGEGIFDLDGLVESQTILERWGVSTRFEAFAPGHRWLPYSGTQTL